MQYGGGGHRFMKLFHKIPLFFEGWLPLGRILLEKSLVLIKSFSPPRPHYKILFAEALLLSLATILDLPYCTFL